MLNISRATVKSHVSSILSKLGVLSRIEAVALAVQQRFGISGIPALLVFQGGQVVERLLGAQPEPVLHQVLTRHVSSL